MKKIPVVIGQLPFIKVGDEKFEHQKHIYFNGVDGTFTQGKLQINMVGGSGGDPTVVDFTNGDSSGVDMTVGDIIHISDSIGTLLWYPNTVSYRFAVISDTTYGGTGTAVRMSGIFRLFTGLIPMAWYSIDTDSAPPYNKISRTGQGSTIGLALTPTTLLLTRNR